MTKETIHEREVRMREQSRRQQELWAALVALGFQEDDMIIDAYGGVILLPLTTNIANLARLEVTR